MKNKLKFTKAHFTLSFNKRTKNKSDYLYIASREISQLCKIKNDHNYVPTKNMKKVSAQNDIV